MIIDKHVEVQDLPAVSVGVDAKTFEAIKQAFDTHVSAGEEETCILDALWMGNDEAEEVLAGLIGDEAAHECCAQLVRFHVVAEDAT